MSRRRYRSDPQQKSNSAKGYDVAMLRDFYEQLLTELRVNNYEQTVPPSHVNPELEEEMTRWAQKREGFLTARNRMHGDSDMTAQEFQKAATFYRAYRHHETQEQIEHLEALRPLMNEVFYCAAHPGTDIVNQLDAREWLKLLEEAEDGREQADEREE